MTGPPFCFTRKRLLLVLHASGQHIPDDGPEQGGGRFVAKAPLQRQDEDRRNDYGDSQELERPDAQHDGALEDPVEYPPTPPSMINTATTSTMYLQAMIVLLAPR